MIHFLVETQLEHGSQGAMRSPICQYSDADVLVIGAAPFHLVEPEVAAIAKVYGG